jgi:putative hydrolase of the HAD superfamily
MEAKNFKCIVFDLGGVVIHLNYEQAVAHFESIGLTNARGHLDAFHQTGIFGALEEGQISAETFRHELSKLVGHELSMDECSYAWHGYVEAVPRQNLQALRKLREQGFRVCLLSNTNPFMMEWAHSTDFDGDGHAIDDYFDALYLSYECHAMKPSADIFRQMLDCEHAEPAQVLFIDDSPANCKAANALGIRTLCPQNNEDWTGRLMDIIDTI